MWDFLVLTKPQNGTCLDFNWVRLTQKQHKKDVQMFKDQRDLRTVSYMARAGDACCSDLHC